MKLRSHLLRLALFSALPIMLMAIAVSYVLVVQERDAFQRGVVDRNRALSTAVDADLRGAMTTLAAVSASGSLAREDFAAFHDQIARIADRQPDLANITLSTLDGQRIVDARLPYGVKLERVSDPDSLRRVSETRAPVVGDLDIDSTTGRLSIPVRAPVVIDGKVRWVVSALVRPESLQALLEAQHPPHGWAFTVLDGKRRFVARVPRRTIGEPASESFHAALARSPDAGWFAGKTVEAEDAYTSYLRSQFSGYVVGIAVPAALVDAGAWRSLALLATGMGGAIAVGIALALLLARGISNPISALASAASSVGRGAEPPPADSGDIEEVVGLANALHDAGGEIRAREAAMKHVESQLVASNRAKDEFLAALSHELRNPLAALTSASRLLGAGRLDESAAARIRMIIERQTRNMSALIEDLLDISRITLGKVTLHRHEFDLAAMVEECVDGWRSAGRFEAGRVVVDAQPTRVNADRIRMEQVLNNLLDNALKFGGKNAIHVSVREEGGMARVVVRDGGEGLTPELLEAAFDLFVQGRQGIERGRGGLGVGLALVRRLVELQGGRAWGESDGPGTGAAFSVEIPAASAPAVEPSDRLARTGQSA